MNADDSTSLRNLPANNRTLLANNRTLVAYIRTALAFAGLGFAVAKFGLSQKMTHVSGYLGTFMVLVGLLVAVIGFVQHRAIVRQLGALSGVPAAARVTHVAAAVGCVLVCALLAIYLAANIG
jgi:putative membrane protein